MDNNAPICKRMIPIGEACLYLGVSRATLLKAEDHGLIRPVRTPGGHRRYGREDLDRLLQHSVAVFEQGHYYRARPEATLPTFINQIASNPSSLEEVAHESIRLLGDSFQADVGAVFALDSQEELHLLAAYGVSSEAASTWASNTITTRVMQDGLPVGYEHLNVDLPGVRSSFQAVCVPLTYRGVTLGVFHLVSTHRYQFYPSEVNILKMVAVYLASLIVDSDRLRQHQRHIEELALIERISHDMQMEVDLRQLLDRFLDGTIEVMGADAGIVFLRDPLDGCCRIHAVRGYPDGVWQPEMTESENIITDCWVLEHGQMRSSADPTNDSCLPPAAKSMVENIASMICLPLKIEGEVIGAFHISSRTPRSFGPDEERFLTTIASQAALIIHRAYLYQQMADLARREAILRKHYEDILEEMPIAIKVVDKDLRILAYNKTMENLTGIKREDALGRIEFEVLPVLKTSPEAMDAFDRLLQTGEMVEGHNVSIPHFHEEETETIFDAKYLPLKDSEGELEGAVLFVQDVTELATLRRQLSAYKDSAA
ncbi:MAG: GAF domain-containing protein [Chloroflexota bacterium]|nr:GAF domain-containing protein [Chloroflexota bacterium]